MFTSKRAINTDNRKIVVFGIDPKRFKDVKGFLTKLFRSLPILLKPYVIIKA